MIAMAFLLGGTIMRRSQNFSRKEIILGITAAILVVSTICGAVVARHQKTSTSNTGQSITIDQSDYKENKNDAIRQIQDAVKKLSEDQQQKVNAYVEQNIQNIQKAETERTIEITLQDTLSYLESVSLGENTEQRKETQDTSDSSDVTNSSSVIEATEEDKYRVMGEDYTYDNDDYIPVINQSNWAAMSEEKREEWLKKCTPVKEDTAHSITAICGNPYDTSSNQSWFLPCRLHSWIVENNLDVTEAEYLAYGTYKKSKETFYLTLNDSNNTVVLVTYNKNLRDFSFEFAGMSVSEVLEAKKAASETSDQGSSSDQETGDAALSESAMKEMENNAETN